MKDKSPQKQLNKYVKQITQTLELWKKQYQNGCNDPFYPDGCNLNLLRNHIFYYKNEIRDICKQNKIDFPGEYFLPIPPQVDNNYFANPKSERAKRIVENYGLCANTREITSKEKNFKMSKVKQCKGWKYQELKFNLEV